MRVKYFEDKEFQSLDLKTKEQTLRNYFHDVETDEGFYLLDKGIQEATIQNFMDDQLDFDISDTVDKISNNIGEILPKKYTKEPQSQQIQTQNDFTQNEDTTTANPITPDELEKKDNALDETKEFLKSAGYGGLVNIDEYGQYLSQNKVQK